MCVNFTPVKRKSLREIVKSEHVTDYPPETYPGYAAPVIRAAGEGGMKADLGVFGLLPAWAKDRAFGKRTYNARTETMAEKPSYRSAWAKKQFCLVPMERFFEPCWETGKAVRWSIQRVDRAPFAVAAIWDQWLDKSTGEIVLSFSMLTINADGHPVMGRFHKPEDEKRSLVIVPPYRWHDWLGANNTTARDMLVEMNAAEFEVTASENRTLRATKTPQTQLALDS
jgi:putative SOS response-associated peptidase YedK